MPKMSGGEALVQSLVREGVEVVFGIPGIHMSGDHRRSKGRAKHTDDNDAP